MDIEAIPIGGTQYPCRLQRLSLYVFSGKTIVPFCTNEENRLGRSVTDVTKLCPQSTILDGLVVRGGNIKNAQNEVSEWLREIGMRESIGGGAPRRGAGGVFKKIKF